MEFFTVFFLGSLSYGLIEILWRGWTHWTMLICGGLCFSLMYGISGLPIAKLKKYILSAAGIITVEFYAGCILNIFLKMDIWDYSDLPFNILGQICPEYFLLWLILSVPGISFCRMLSGLFRRAQ